MTFFTIDVHKVSLEAKFRICRKGNKDTAASLTFFFFFPDISIHFVLLHWLWSSSTARKSVSEIHLTPVIQDWAHEACWTMRYWHAVFSWSPPSVLALFPHCTMLFWYGKRTLVLLEKHMFLYYERGYCYVYITGGIKFTHKVSKVLLSYFENEA